MGISRLKNFKIRVRAYPLIDSMSISHIAPKLYQPDYNGFPYNGFLLKD